MKKLCMIVVIEFISRVLFAQEPVVCYVSLKGSDNNSGSIEKPFASIYKAQEYIRHQRSIKPGNFTVILRGGVYELAKPISFNSQLDPDESGPIEFKAYPGEKVTISGGKILTGTWVKVPDHPSVWKLNLTSTFDIVPHFRSLFRNGTRLQRASSDTLISDGPLPQFARLYKVYDFAALNQLEKNSLNVLSCFKYSDHDLDDLTDIDDAEALVYGSWEASWNRIYKIDKEHKAIYFRNPASYPDGFYPNPRIRYVIENSFDYLNKPGEWYFDAKGKNVFYYASSGENPNEVQFIAPVLDTILIAKGDGKANKLVSNIKFSNIDFSYSGSAWGVNEIHFGIPFIHQLHDSCVSENKKRYPWLDFTQGFSSFQAALGCGSAITLEACKNWTFDHCSFLHLGNYAIGIIDYSSDNTISNCYISDIGGGGIMIAFNAPGGKLKWLPESISPTGNKVLDCVINNCGVIFPSGVGIGVMQANHTLVRHNLIYNMPYVGISVGWTFSLTLDNYTTYNTIEYNNIHDVMEKLNDGGGIYTLGKQVGCLYKGNFIYNVRRANNSIGAHNNGFFFDVGSCVLKVDSNVVFNAANEDKRFNLTDSTKTEFGYNYWEKATPSNKALKDIIYKKVLK